jgi:hypothetical protein
MNLPTLPKIAPGIKYPPGQLEGEFDTVLKTDPKLYLKEIKYMLRKIEEYRDCLGHHGYVLENIETLDKDKVIAKKVIIIR